MGRRFGESVNAGFTQIPARVGAETAIPHLYRRCSIRKSSPPPVVPFRAPIVHASQTYQALVSEKIIESQGTQNVANRGSFCPQIGRVMDQEEGPARANGMCNPTPLPPW